MKAVKGIVVAVSPDTANAVLDVVNGLDSIGMYKKGSAASILTTLANDIDEAAATQINNPYESCGVCGGSGIVEEQVSAIEHVIAGLRECYEHVEKDENEKIREAEEMLVRILGDRKDNERIFRR